MRHTVFAVVCPRSCAALAKEYNKKAAKRVAEVNRALQLKQGLAAEGAVRPAGPRAAAI